MDEILGYIEEDPDRCIIGFGGLLGKAKTIGAVALAFFLGRLLNKTEIITNTPLNFNFPSSMIYYYDELTDLHKPPKDNKIYLLDEVHQIVDSRKTKLKENLFTADVTTDIRKGDNILIMTTPNMNLVEKRVAQLCRLLIYPRILEKDIPNEILKVEFQVIDLDDVYDFYDYANLGTFLGAYNTKYKPKKLEWMKEES